MVSFSAVRTVYFDYNATTPLDPTVREAMAPYMESIWGNPSSVHHVGRRARAVLDEAHERVARVFKARPSEIIFTSGGTESNNLAIFGTARRMRHKGGHLVTSTVEHHAVLHCFRHLEKSEGFQVTYIPVDSEGRVAPEAVAKALRPDTTLVSVMSANNEIGTIQPVAQIGALCRKAGVLFHTDAAQWFGKEPFADIHQFNADLVSVCAHKFHGPKGAGALYIRSPFHPDPILFGGGHENERRAGTENLAAIVGLATAVERFVSTPVFDSPEIDDNAMRLRAAVASFSSLGVTLRGPVLGGLLNTVAFTVRDADSESLLAALDLEGICASSGSACSSGALEPSHVIVALGATAEEAASLVRFSLGRENTGGEVQAVIRALPGVISRVQAPE